jgi:GT2 family glycosyltransferase
MDHQPTVAACSPKIKSYDQKTMFEYAGAAGGCMDLFGYPFCYGRILKTLEQDTGQFESTRDVFWVSGACMMVKSELYHRYGGLDQDFFAHMEEIDFCWRMQNQGFRLCYVPGSEIFHVGGGALPNESPRKLFLNYRNNLLMLYKNLPAKQMYRVLSVRMFFDGLSAFVYLMTGRFSYFTAVWKAHSDFYHRLPSYRIKRTLIQRYQGRINYAGYYDGSILWAYFVKGIRSALALKPKMLE